VTAKRAEQKKTDQGQSADAIEFADRRLEGPLVIHPGLPGFGEAQRIDPGNLAGIENDFRRAQVPAHAGIVEHSLRAMEGPKLDQQEDEEAQGGQPPDRP